MADDGDKTSKPQRRANGTALPGFTPNPKGRPPKSRNLLTLFHEKADEKVTVKVDGKPVRMSRKEAWVTNLWSKAMATDPKASSIVMAFFRGSGELDPKPGEETELSPDDDAVLRGLIDRLGSRKKDGNDV